MIDTTGSLVTQAHKHYSKNGITSLVKRGIELVLAEPIKRRSVSRDKLKEIATRRNAIWYTDTEDVITISPLSHTVLKSAFEQYPKRYTPDQPFVCEIEDCYLIGPDAVGMTHDGRVITETLSGDFPSSNSLGSCKREFYTRGLNLKKEPFSINSDNAVFPLISEYHSYYHWMVEYLPKLRLLECYEKKTNSNPTILIESDPPAFVKESLSVAGYNSNQYTEWCGSKRQIQNLIVPIHRSHRFNYQYPKKSDYNPSRDDLLWLRERMRSNTDFDTENNNKIIYISRQKVPSERGRKVINYDSLIDIIRDFGGREYVLEELSFEKQIQIFAEADIIIGPHGAGLLNMIFADDPVVIELFPETVLKPHFYFMAEMMGVDYKPIVTESEGENLIVDEKEFQNYLELVYEST